MPTCDGATRPIEQWVKVEIPDAGLLTAVSAVDDDFAVAVGKQGTVMMWNGTSWSFANAPLSEDLAGVWANSPTNVWAIAEEDVEHWDGTRWTTFSFDGGYLNSVWGSDAGVWAVNFNTAGLYELRDQGLANLPVVTVQLDAGSALELPYTTWGLSVDDLWVADADRGLVQLTTSSPVTVAVPFSATSLWGSSDRHVIVAGMVIENPTDGQSCGEAAEWNGASLTTPYVWQCGLSEMGPVWGACDSEVWILENTDTTNALPVCRWVDAGCIQESLPPQVQTDYIVTAGISGSAHNVWIVGSDAEQHALIFRAQR